MKNKIIVFLILGIGLIFLPTAAHAEKILHTNVFTDRGDGTFHFMVASYVWIGWFLDTSFDITTNNSSGTGPTEDVSENPPGYSPAYHSIEETVPQDYKFSRVDCYCDNGYHSPFVFSYSGSKVYISPQNDSSPDCSQNYYCDFYNTRIKYPVLIVPGLMGTEMKEGNTLLWPDVVRMINPFNSDNFMDPLQFGQALVPSDNNVTIGGTVGEPFPGEHYYDLLINELKNQGYVEGQDLFMFPYDWRYGVSGKYADGKTNTDLLAQKIQDILQQTGASKIDVIAHSLGGLITKQYVMNHPTDNHIGKAVFVGVPNTGAPKAVKALLQGDNMGVLGLNDQEIKKISANMPSAYDLLPSQQYYNVAGSFVSMVDIGYGIGISDPTEKDLNYSDFTSYLDNKGLNSTATANSQNLHTASFDNFDLRTAGVDLYAINGCKAATMANFLEVSYKDILGNQHTDYDNVELKAGDNTVPLDSATNLPINSQNKYYALVSDHGKMPSQDGIRQKIVNLISGSNLSVGNNLITQDISQCNLDGKAISVFSPINIFVTDQNGNRLGLADDGSIINEIPNADFEIMGDHKFLYLPQDSGQTYSINLNGTGTGTYTIKSENISNSQVTSAEIFSDLPVTPALTGQINLLGDTTTLSLNNSPTPVLPSRVLDFSQDKTPPEAIIRFDQNVKDLSFYGTDNLSDIFSISIVDNGNTVTLKDEAGNTTELGFKERNRKSAMSAEIVSIKYNGASVSSGSNLFFYSWFLDKAGNLTKLTQKVKSRNNYSITAVYDGINTKITGATSAGKISQYFSGLKIIKVTTNKGDLSWSY